LQLLDETGLQPIKQLALVFPLLPPNKQADVLLNLLQYIYPKRRPDNELDPHQKGLTFTDFIKLLEEMPNEPDETNKEGESIDDTST
jgi:hypothetical protein